MPDWKCTRCGVINLEGQRACEGCGKEPEGRPRAAGVSLGSRKVESAEPAAAPREPVTTWEQGREAAKILQAIATQAVSVEEGRRQMAAVLKLPTLPDVEQ